MRGLRRLSLASVAMVWGRVPCRLNSRGGQPPAPLGARILTNPEDVFQHNMWYAFAHLLFWFNATFNVKSEVDNMLCQRAQQCILDQAYSMFMLTWLCFRDHVKWSEEEKEKARQKADDNSSLRIPLEEQGSPSLNVPRKLCSSFWLYEN